MQKNMACKIKINVRNKVGGLTLFIIHFCLKYTRATMLNKNVDVGE